MLRDEVLNSVCMGTVLCNVAEQATNITVNGTSRVSRHEQGGDGGVLIHMHECGHHIVKADIPLRDKLVAKQIVDVHTTECCEENKLVHTLIKGETSQGDTIDLVPCITNMIKEIHVWFIETLFDT